MSHAEQSAAIREQFGKQAPAYARLVRSRSDGSFTRLVAALRPGSDAHVLDVGCGPGLLTLALAECAGRVTGIDLTPEMLEQAQALQAELAIGNVQWQQGDILPQPFPDGAFSIVVTKATFHHLTDPAAVLAQMIRVCATGGRIAVSDVTPDPTRIEAFDRIEKLRDPSHVHALSAEHLRSLGRAAGLDELTFWQTPTTIPLEAVLATSFPEPGNLARVRSLYREDADSGEDRFGLSTRDQNGQLWVSYPMTTMVWVRG